MNTRTTYQPKTEIEKMLMIQILHGDPVIRIHTLFTPLLNKTHSVGTLTNV